MTVAEWCVFGTLMLYLLTIVSVKWSGISPFRQCEALPSRILRRPDSRPRARCPSERRRGLSVLRRRGAAGGISLGPQRLIDELAVLYLIVRIAYVFTYLGDRPTLRSILWAIGFAINVGIFFMPAIRGYLG